MNYLQMVLESLGLVSNKATREDSAFTSVLSRQLEVVKARTYDVRYPNFRARQFIPVNSDTDPGAETIGYNSWDSFGMAQIIANYSDDLPMVDALVERQTVNVVGIGLGYQYSIQDLRRAGLANLPLQQQKAMATRRFFEQKIEDMGAFGESSAGIYGLANNPNVTLFTPTTGTWSTATGLQIVQDVLNWYAAFVSANKETFLPDTLLLSIPLLNRLNTALTSTTGDGSMTAMSMLRASLPGTLAIESWYKLSLANAGGTGPRAIMYARTPEVLTLEIPQEFEQLPPQAKNLAFIVPTHGRCAGVIIYYPIGVGYMDGL